MLSGGWISERVAGDREHILALEEVQLAADLELLLAEHAVDDLVLRNRGEHIDTTRGEPARNRPVAIDGVAQDPLGALFWRLAVDQVLGLRAIGLAGRADIHRDDQRLAADHCRSHSL
jgi:hypothetical protein